MITLPVEFTAEQEALLQEEAGKLPASELALRELTADIVVHEVGLSQSAVAAIVLKSSKDARVQELFDKQVQTIISGLHRVDEIYRKNMSLETENFRKLLLALAEDVRVVLIIIAERVALMRQLNADAEAVDKKKIAEETSFLYAPLAHRLGLYTLKTELEDLSLKFSNYTIYKEIARALNEKKQQRDAYVAAFIKPVEEKLLQMGLHFHIKGRTKSIHSIYNKMQKQQCGVDGIYDLFAIRIILDSAPEKEKAECWQVYSVVTDMYQPNPKRLRDWLSIPKSNGYESLHTTVLGPENKWVEVQIRTERMDEVAEKGVAAHWKYKGGKAETGMDEFLKGVREMLESEQVDTKEAISEFRMNLYDEEVFVFTPNGDLHKLPKGSTVLDFAFSIHSGLGCRCVGGKIGGRNVPIKYVLHNGDQVEILQSAQQHPNESWLKLVHTSKAKSKIRQALKEVEFKDAAEGKELFERRFKNWKIDYTEGDLAHLSKKLGFKTISNFYQAIAQGALDLLSVRERFYSMQEQAAESSQGQSAVSAGNYVQMPAQQQEVRVRQDELVIDRNLKDVVYKLAKCCNPIYGDPIFGFVSITSGIKIHRQDCPNAADMRARFPYRIQPARWSGKAVGQHYPITLQVVGVDDIGIVSNISSIIAKEEGVLMRTISIDSHDGIFEGHMTILVATTEQLENVQRKIKTVQGVKSVSRM
ncbi:MAG: bifunctional (p)ppGpp synthetase/guanosine-3',5'-bis(diphosphate) 3'-pyrophosphohydrolase [Bacteroidales bacterium]|nr:bifunctional (p)ppGpp synthetase/guanosine-3',5'-bis(diphosphate) 3'-pyrophosphohydrolase [Candidatus Colicola faecequi]